VGTAGTIERGMNMDGKYGKNCRAIKILLRTENGRRVGINKGVVNYIEGKYVEPPDDDRFGALAVFDTFYHARKFLEYLWRAEVIEIWEAEYVPAEKRRGLQCPDIDGSGALEIMLAEIYPRGTLLADKVKITKLIEVRKTVGKPEWEYDSLMPGCIPRRKPTLWEIIFSDLDGKGNEDGN